MIEGATAGFTYYPLPFQLLLWPWSLGISPLWFHPPNCLPEMTEFEQTRTEIETAVFREHWDQSSVAPPTELPAMTEFEETRAEIETAVSLGDDLCHMLLTYQNSVPTMVDDVQSNPDMATLAGGTVTIDLAHPASWMNSK